MEKFINWQIFEKLARPPIKGDTTIAAITSAFNYLFNADYQQSLIAKIIGKTTSKTCPNILPKWIELAAAYLKLNLKVRTYFSGGWPLEEAANEGNWVEFVNLIKDKNNFLLLKMGNHCSVIMGYATYPYSKQPGDDGINKWIVIGEVNPWSRVSWIRALHLALAPPIWMVRFEFLRKTLSQNRQNGILCISRDTYTAE